MARTARDAPVPRLHGTSLVAELGKRLRAALATALRWQDLARQRRDLVLMDDRTLKDIGLTRAEARRLAARIPRDEFGRWLGRAPD
jgi:uncharacterized protein YjiS (DUF1127 family)